MIINTKTGTNAVIAEANSMDLLYLRGHHIHRGNAFDFPFCDHCQFFLEGSGAGIWSCVFAAYGQISGLR